MEKMARVMEMLKQAPGDLFLQHALALEYVKAGNEVAARALFESILLTNPGYVGSYYHLGKLLERIGDPATAIEWYEKGMMAAKTAGDNHALGELRGAREDLDD